MVSRKMALVAGLVLAGVALQVQAKPDFPSVVGGWIVSGTVNTNIKVCWYKDNTTVPVPAGAALFEDTGDFSMFWGDLGTPTYFVQGAYAQKSKKITSTSFTSAYYSMQVLHQLTMAGVDVSAFTQGPIKFNATMTDAGHMKGSIQIQYLVTTGGGAKGKVIVKIAFTGTR